MSQSAILIDDNALFLNLLSNQLATLGVKVFQARDKEELLAHLEYGWFDWAFIDAHLEDGECGLQLASILREQQSQHEQPCQLIGMSGDEICASRYATVGIDTYFVKPISLHQLQALLGASSKQK
ncbi:MULTISPECIES: response regulator [unclassified Pseudoalteromonas]|uniref:response regulator n=1 Tax=unclassified Pseudoalteromonas TaxID=194690 RepID=UPI002096E9DC|nr:response regulator [Pseudoalteromonas sp. XMcav2-N]MCO7189003.1 response regulator [Pseudoalteromonas sp. XMcav2-N]